MQFIHGVELHFDFPDRFNDVDFVSIENELVELIGLY